MMGITTVIVILATLMSVAIVSVVVLIVKSRRMFKYSDKTKEQITPKKKRKLKDSLYNVEYAYASDVLGTILGAAAVLSSFFVMTSDAETSTFAGVFLFVVGILLLLYTPICLIALKRNHESRFWDYITRIMMNECFLIPHVKSIDDLVYHLSKNRRIIFLHESKTYMIRPCLELKNKRLDYVYDNVYFECPFALYVAESTEFFKGDLDKMPEIKFTIELFQGDIDSLLKFEFESEVSLNGNFSDIRITHVFKRYHYLWK